MFQNIGHITPVTGLFTVPLLHLMLLTSDMTRGRTALVPFMTSQTQRSDRDAPFSRFKGKSYDRLLPSELQFNPIHKLRVPCVNSIRISSKEKED